MERPQCFSFITFKFAYLSFISKVCVEIRVSGLNRKSLVKRHQFKRTLKKVLKCANTFFPLHLKRLLNELGGRSARPDSFEVPSNFSLKFPQRQTIRFGVETKAEKTICERLARFSTTRISPRVVSRSTFFGLKLTPQPKPE